MLRRVQQESPAQEAPHQCEQFKTRGTVTLSKVTPRLRVGCTPQPVFSFSDDQFSSFLTANKEQTNSKQTKLQEQSPCFKPWLTTQRCLLTHGPGECQTNPTHPVSHQALIQNQTPLRKGVFFWWKNHFFPGKFGIHWAAHQHLLDVPGTQAPARGFCVSRAPSCSFAVETSPCLTCF